MIGTGVMVLTGITAAKDGASCHFLLCHHDDCVQFGHFAMRKWLQQRLYSAVRTFIHIQRWRACRASNGMRRYCPFIC
ncbi:hypothetical protein ACEQPO_01335 [Bacillus sp. SL00103]